MNNNVKISYALLLTVITFGAFAQKIDYNRIEELGKVLHFMAKTCAATSDSVMENFYKIMDLAERMTGFELLEAVTFKINEEDCFDVARAQNCKACDEFLRELRVLKMISEYSVKHGKGDLTIQEIQHDDKFFKQMFEDLGL
jgi:hypothetical protein